MNRINSFGANEGNENMKRSTVRADGIPAEFADMIPETITLELTKKEKTALVSVLLDAITEKGYMDLASDMGNILTKLDAWK